MKTTEKLVDELVAGLEPVSPPPTNNLVTLGWLAVSAACVAMVIHLAGPIRLGAFTQLHKVPHFTLEMILGAGAALTLALAAFRSATPGLLDKRLLWLALGLITLWVGSIAASLFSPALDTGMLGKRDHCVYETLLYGLPPLVVLLMWQRRLFVLAPVRSAMLAGLAAGILPALYMQIACMHDASHILLFHVAPAFVLAALAPAVAWLLNRRSTAQDKT